MKNYSFPEHEDTRSNKKMIPKNLKDRIKSIPKKTILWKGPIEDGVTFSMLSKFLTCRERFRIYITEGLRGNDSFNARMEYGNMFHLCKEKYLAKQDWTTAIQKYCLELCQRFPESQELILHWKEVCMIQFKIYTRHWKDLKDKQPYYQEKVFDVKHMLPTGRVVRLRGKWDSVDIYKKQFWIQENKTKSEINSPELLRQLRNDFQSMIYATAFTESELDIDLPQFGGVRYNVILRPLSGGRGTIRQKKKETKEEYYSRLKETLEGMVQERPDQVFTRFEVGISKQDLKRFRETTLDPILENLCDWYEWIKFCFNNKKSPFGMIHWTHPNGSFNSINEGYEHELDHYIENGNTVGLTRVKSLFRELE